MMRFLFAEPGHMLQMVADEQSGLTSSVKVVIQGISVQSPSSDFINVTYNLKKPEAYLS